MLSDSRQKAVYLSLGLFVSFSTFAVFREQIFKSNYDGEKFIYPISFSALQFFINSITAKGMMKLKITQDHTDNETPQKYYMLIAFFNVLTMIASNMALQFVPYVVLVVGKACKPIPVMIFTAIIAKKCYTIQRCIFVTMIAFGVGLFIFEEGTLTSNEMLLGNILIFISLLLEGFLSGAQSKMRIQSKPSSINYMFYVNTWCALLILPLLLINFEVIQFVKFCMRHNDVVLLVLAAAITGSIGHYFSSAIISNFGPLPLSLISTTRKFFTVFLSSLIFGNFLSLRQWIASVIIFEALTLDIFYGKRKLLNNKEEQNKETPKTVQVDSETKDPGNEKNIPENNLVSPA